MSQSSTLSPFFNARGVAILGASTNPKKLSYGIVENLLKYHYAGQVYPVNPNAAEVLGLKAYPSVTDVPDPVDLAVIVLPVTTILENLTACGERGIKAVIIITGGFKELGPEGAAVEDAAHEVAKRYGMRVVGPNCVGTVDIRTGLNTTFIKGLPDPGPIAFISQSGAICGGVIDLIADTHIGFSHFASLGNEMDVSEADMLEYFGEDSNVKVIAMYVEGLKDGPRFMQIAREVTARKPVVFLKAGKNEAGAKAVSSHTGSLAGSYAAYQAALRQCGVIEVNTIHELFNAAWALGCQPLPSGNRVAITTNAGGAAALASDSLASNGFTLATIHPDIQAKLRTRLNPSAQVSNPVDMLGSVSPEDYIWSLSNLDNDPGVDVLLPILVPQALVDTAGVAQAWIEIAKNTQKTMLTCLMGNISTKQAADLLNIAKVPVYDVPDAAGPVLKALKEYADIRERTRTEPVTGDPKAKAEVDRLLAAHPKGSALGEAETRDLLNAYGIPNVPGGMAENVSKAVEIAERVGYPVALKVVAEKILHKSDAGGIVLNLKNEEELRVAYEEITSRITKNFPDPGLRGAMVEAMAPRGQEVIVGMSRDVTFGPVMLFGMGGTLVELVKDVSRGIAPLGKDEIIAMIDETAAGKLLRGYRGGSPADIDAVVDAIEKLTQLALAHPGIQEIEINPLVVYEKAHGALALDSRAILGM